MRTRQRQEALLYSNGVNETVASDGGLVVRPLRDVDADYGLLAAWLSDPAVLEWYEGRDQVFDEARVRAEFAPRVLEQEQVRPCIIELDGRPAGYLQYYPVADPADYELDAADDAWAFDLFIGRPGLWGTGLGSRVLRLMSAFVFATCGARRIVIDPRVDNPRAIRAYEKSGFRRAKVLVGHEAHEGEMRDCWLMVLERPGDQAGT
jgi:aminoglycoside 6'-N-acetyltransferase